MSLPLENYESISCASASDCYLVGSSIAGSAYIAFTTNGGTTWANQLAPSAATDLWDVACPSLSDCFAAGVGADGSGAVILST